MVSRNLMTTLTLAATFALSLTTSVFAQFSSSDFTKLNRFVQTSNSSDSAMQVFRVGRDFIEDERWEQAEKRFRDFLRDYPRHKEVDAAMYWLAFTQKKQQHFQEAERLLVKLCNEYPRSNWIDDAKALRLEIAPSVGNVAYVDQVARPVQPTRVITVPREVSAQSPRPAPAPQPAIAPIAPEFPIELNAPLQGLDNLDRLYAIGQGSVRGGLDEKDEIKAIALQSLLQSNPERALSYITEILKKDSNASKGLKETAIRLLGTYRGANSTTMLLDLARSQNDPAVRRSAIYSLSNVEDDKVFDLLADLATKSDDPEVSKAALRALAARRNPKARQKLFDIARSASNEDTRAQAVQSLISSSDENLVDELVKIYQNDKSLKVRKQAVLALSNLVNSHGRFWAVPAISGTGSNVNVTGLSGQNTETQKKNSEKAVKALLQLYDAENDEALKGQVLFAFSQSDSKDALQKLMQIAKNDSSMNVRRRAVMYLGRSRNPDAVKFMEELLK